MLSVRHKVRIEELLDVAHKVGRSTRDRIQRLLGRHPRVTERVEQRQPITSRGCSLLSGRQRPVVSRHGCVNQFLTCGIRNRKVTDHSVHFVLRFAICHRLGNLVSSRRQEVVGLDQRVSELSLCVSRASPSASGLSDGLCSVVDVDVTHTQISQNTTGTLYGIHPSGDTNTSTSTDDRAPCTLQSDIAPVNRTIGIDGLHESGDARLFNTLTNGLQTAYTACGKPSGYQLLGKGLFDCIACCSDFCGGFDHRADQCSTTRQDGHSTGHTTGSHTTLHGAIVGHSQGLILCHLSSSNTRSKLVHGLLVLLVVLSASRLCNL